MRNVVALVGGLAVAILVVAGAHWFVSNPLESGSSGDRKFLVLLEAGAFAAMIGPFLIREVIQFLKAIRGGQHERFGAREISLILLAGFGSGLLYVVLVRVVQAA